MFNWVKSLTAEEQKVSFFATKNHSINRIQAKDEEEAAAAAAAKAAKEDQVKTPERKESVPQEPAESEGAECEPVKVEQAEPPPPSPSPPPPPPPPPPEPVPEPPPKEESLADVPLGDDESEKKPSDADIGTGTEVGAEKKKDELEENGESATNPAATNGGVEGQDNGSKPAKKEHFVAKLFKGIRKKGDKSEAAEQSDQPDQAGGDEDNKDADDKKALEECDADKKPEDGKPAEDDEHIVHKMIKGLWGGSSSTGGGAASGDPDAANAAGAANTANKTEEKKDEKKAEDETAGFSFHQIFADTTNKLFERGEKLDEINNKTENLANEAQGFAAAARRIREQEEAKKWWQF